MKTKATVEKLYRWNFCLVDELPGPSWGDAIEFIEALGLDPWAFDSLDPVRETVHGPTAATEFEATGSEQLLLALHAAHARTTGSVMPPPSPVTITNLPAPESPSDSVEVIQPI